MSESNRIEEFRERHERIREKIARYADPDEVTIVWVTKTFDAATVRDAVSAGAHAVGENYAQEFVQKFDATPELKDRLDWHFIGHLQSNKAAMVAARADVIQSISREKELTLLAKLGFGGELYLQVRDDNDPSRNGVLPTELPGLLERGSALGLQITGLMGVASLSGSHEPSKFFRLLRELVDRFQLQNCSMGMSDDFELAVANGANVVRLGRSLLGARRVGPA